ncbi:ATP-binding cassette transporter snq2 [Savitreella phatthalungensis]
MPDQELQSGYGEDTRPVDVAAAENEFRSLRRQVTKHSIGSNTHDEEENFDLEQFLKDGRIKEDDLGRAHKALGVIFKDLTVRGIDPGSSTIKTFPEALWRTISGQEIVGWVNSLTGGKLFKPPTRNILQGFDGFVKPGEILLVLGRPGAGCSTFLRALANQRDGFAGVDGQVTYGGLTADEIAKHYRGEVTYVPSDDVHLPTLTVEQTLSFALSNKTQKKFRGEVELYLNAFLKMFNIEHTRQTLVGNEYVRGVSGGERKRVSIAEVLATRSSVTCWDNSTKGLDASTALDYIKSLRIMTDISNRATVVTLYQAGQSIYDLVDKVCVIDGGRMLYFGGKDHAREYFQGLGYLAPDRQTTPDFLTSVGDVNERRFQPDREATTPKGPEALEAVFRQSDIYRRMLEERDAYEQSQTEADNFRTAVHQSKSKYATRTQYTASFMHQVWMCTKRNYWLVRGNITDFFVKLAVIIINALIIGSLFYNIPQDTSGAFSIGGVLFMSMVFVGWLQLSELATAVMGRPVIARHKEHTLYKPSAVVLARAITDLPLILILVTPFTVVIYFLGSLDRQAGKFFIFYLFVFLSTFCLTSLFRMFAAISPTINEAFRYSGLFLNVAVVVAGYVIAQPQLSSQVPWIGWLQWLDPLHYIFEAVMSNEFTGRDMECAPGQIVPYGAGYNDVAYQSCTLRGSTPGSLTVSGTRYIAEAYNYSRSRLWKEGFAVTIAWIVLYLLVTCIAVEYLSFVPAGASIQQFKSKRAIKHADEAKKEEDEKTAGSSGSSVGSDETATLARSESVFTWRDVDFTVSYPGGQRQLLNKVQGWSKPGEMIALMGASGAGKTTLLNTLSQRNASMGVVSGDMLVDGAPLGPSFGRGTGFVEQMDLHDEFATVREAFEFSALLRQDASTPRTEKLAYVDKVIDLLEMRPLAECIVMTLDVEQKKRLTIGVELCAKPSLLLFLDEPTSGLDSQSAFNIVRFLRSLARAGQAIVCTIHQPSSELILEFDRVLALNPGGKTFYFGPVGENGAGITEYFGKRGAKCPPEANPAEFLLEVGTGRGLGTVDGQRIDWSAVWRDSDECKEVSRHIDAIHADRAGVKSAATTEYASEYAASTWEQTKVLTHRVWRNYWRDASYGYSRMWAFFMNGALAGLVFLNAGRRPGILYLQEELFAVFLPIILPATVINSVIPKFGMAKMLFLAREGPSRIYGWIPFTTSLVLCEMPYAILGTFFYWPVWFWPIFSPQPSTISGYSVAMVILFNLFAASWGQWIAATTNSWTVLSVTVPLYLVLLQLFTGIIRPVSQFPKFWLFIYYSSPVRYFISGLLAAVLHGKEVRCLPEEFAIVNPPTGQSCSSYLGPFLENYTGYLDNPGDSTACRVCQFSNADQYLDQLQFSYGFRWQSLGILAAFCITNVLLVYFFVYTRMMKNSTYGVGYLINKVHSVFKRKSRPE